MLKKRWISNNYQERSGKFCKNYIMGAGANFIAYSVKFSDKSSKLISLHRAKREGNRRWPQAACLQRQRIQWCSKHWKGKCLQNTLREMRWARIHSLDRTWTEGSSWGLVVIKRKPKNCGCINMYEYVQRVYFI